MLFIKYSWQIILQYLPKNGKNCVSKEISARSKKAISFYPVLVICQSKSKKYYEYSPQV